MIGNTGELPRSLQGDRPGIARNEEEFAGEKIAPDEPEARPRLRRRQRHTEHTAEQDCRSEANEYRWQRSVTIHATTTSLRFGQ